MTTVDQNPALGPEYDWYYEALAGKKPPMLADEPQCGFFIKRQRGEIDQPVSIFINMNHAQVAIVGFDHSVDEAYQSAAGLWTRVCDHPIPEERYWKAIDAGEWPDQLSAEILPAKGSVIGDNAPADKVAEFKDLIDAATKRADDVKIVDDDSLAGAQSLRSRLLELARDGTKEHDDEKAPHLAAGREVDDRWRFLAAATDAAKGIVAKIAKYADAKREKAAAERRAAEEEQRRLEREAAAANKPAPAPPPAPEPEPTSTTFRGSYGRAANLKPIIVLDTITDIGLLAKHFEKNAKLVALLIQLANAQLKVDVTPPGITTRETTAVR